MATPFFPTLEARAREANSLLCVGLDPHAADLQIPPDASLEQKAVAAEKFCVRLIDETHHVAAAFKPNSAFFEALGWRGVAALERVVEHVPKNVPVLIDAKRGDISTTAEAYAEAAFATPRATAVTVAPYMGWDSVEPFVRDAARGAFVLCKTSNPSSKDFETLPVNGPSGDAVFVHVARKIAEWNSAKKNVGMVVGATDADAVAKARAVAPDVWILAPGVGFQGGDLEATVAAGVRVSDGLGLLLPVSRAVSRAASPKEAAEKLRDDINRARAAAAGSANSPPKKPRAAASSSPSSLAPFQRDFFELALKCGVLKFGKFTLKSGRESPYFFNAGLFNTGGAVHALARCYAEAVVRSGIEFDVVFGPAYKGIPLAATVAAELFSAHGRDVPYAYNRKEAKDHGEGGVIVGAKIEANTRVLVLDDVITAGTAVRESVELLSKMNAKVAGLVVAIDRQEVAPGETTRSAVAAVQETYGFPVVSIVTLRDLLTYCADSPERVGGADVLRAVEEYRKKYGAPSSSSSSSSAAP